MASKPSRSHITKQVEETVTEVVDTVAEVTPEVVVQTPAVQEVAPPVDEIAMKYAELGDIGIPISDDLKQLIGKMVSTYGDICKINLIDLADFITVMMPPKQVPVDQGVQQQQKLWVILKNVLSVQGGYYNALITSVLGLISEYSNTVFNDLYIFRYQDQLHLNATQRRAFRLVLTLMKEVSDPKTRFENAKTVRPNVAMDGVFEEHAITQLKKYLRLAS